MSSSPYHPLRIALLLAVLGSTACERHRVELLESESEPAARANQPARQDDLLSKRAFQALVSGDFQRCADDFARAAADGPTSQAGQRLHRAATCSARGGNYRESLFHIYAAAAAGYDELEAVRTDPWLRPLHDTSRWRVVLDQLAANERERESTPPGTTLCALLQEHFRL